MNGEPNVHSIHARVPLRVKHVLEQVRFVRGMSYSTIVTNALNMYLPTLEKRQ